MRCQQCGSPVQGAFCTNCGAMAAPPPVPSVGQVPPSPQNAPGWPGANGGPPSGPPTSGSGGSKAGLVLVGLLVGGLLVVLAGGAFLGARFLLVNSGDNETPVPPAATPSQTPTPEPTPEPTESTKPKKSKAKGPGDIRDLPAGLFCRDLKSDGYSYSAAVDYWRTHGQPDQMDANRDGIPCETVYPADRVSDYWGDRMPKPDAPTYVPPVDDSYLDLPAGLLCRDLLASGHSYGDALSYWYYWGMPDRMDADQNGIPCETVYPRSTVDLYW